MIVNTNSTFIKYDLTDDEIRAGRTFSPEHRAIIQNLISDLAEEKVSLTYNPDEPLKFAQREAELAGQIGILKYLLEINKE
jgi:hypothetical protein